MIELEAHICANTSKYICPNLYRRERKNTWLCRLESKINETLDNFTTWADMIYY